MENYHIVELVGEGSFGKVFKARRKSCGHIVAMKFILKKGKNEKELRNLRTEIDILIKLNHDNIVSLLDAFETVNEFEEALNSLDAPLPESEPAVEPLEIGDVSFAEAPREETAAPEVKHVRVRSNIDILAELEKLRKNATSTPPVEKPGRRATTGISIDDLLANSLNHRKEVNRIFELQIPQRELAEGHQVTVDLRLEDKDRRMIGEQKSFSIELHTRQDIEKLLLSLKFHIFGK
jgi:hypothetical protein